MKTPTYQNGQDELAEMIIRTAIYQGALINAQYVRQYKDCTEQDGYNLDARFTELAKSCLAELKSKIF
jgi:hypothetical protein